MVDKGKGFDVYVRTVIKNALRKEVKAVWTLRTNGKSQTEWDMARALAEDLARSGVPWQIRNANGEVVESGPVVVIDSGGPGGEYTAKVTAHKEGDVVVVDDVERHPPKK